MAWDVKKGFVGLATNVAEIGASEGALRDAENVVVRRHGAIENRQGFRPLPSISLVNPSGKRLVNSVPYGDLTMYETDAGWLENNSGLGDTLKWPRPGSGNVAPAKRRADSFSIVRSRGNLYLPSSEGVMAMSSPNDLAWRLGGVSGLRLQLTAFTAAGSVLPDNSRVAYRAVLKRRGPDGLLTKSRPTGAIVVTNAGGGGAIGVQLGANVHNMTEYESVEFYRTRIFSSSVQVDDEMDLIAEKFFEEFSGGSIKFIVFGDVIADSARGARLYTSPSLGGMSGANDSPPACGAVEAYRGSLFFGNCVGPSRLVVSYNFGGDRTNQATGIGRRVYTGTWASGTNTMTVSSAVGLQKGQLVDTSGFGRRITNISGLTVTVNADFSTSGAGASVTFHDQIQVDGDWSPENDDSNPDAYGWNLFVASLGRFGAYSLTPPATGYDVTLVIERQARDVGVFGVRATHGDEFSPPLPLHDDVAKETEQDVYPNVLVWSDPDQPEHVPPRNYAFVGDRTKALLALAATRDALFIIKEDGIWRLSGFNGQWRIDPFDMTTFCVLPSSVVRLNNAIYMLSNKGIVRVSDEGVLLLSDQAGASVQNLVRALVDAAQAANEADGYYHYGNLGSANYAMVDARNSEYILLTGGILPDVQGDALVYNESTNAWTTYAWEPGSGFGQLTPTGCGLTGTGNAPTFFKTGGAHVSSYDTVTIGGVTYPLVADDSKAITITGVNAGVVDYTTATALIVGDVIVQGANVFPVIGITSTTRCTVDTTAATPSGGAATAYRSVACLVRPHGFAAPEASQKAWAEVVAAFSRLVGPTKVEAIFSSAQVLAPEALQIRTERFDVALSGACYKSHLGTLLRHTIPSDHARSWLLRAALSWPMAFGQATLEALVAESRDYVPNRKPSHTSGVAV